VSVCLCSTESGCRFGASCRFTHSTGGATAADKLENGGKDGVVAGLAEVTGDAVVSGVEAAMASLNVMESSAPLTAADNSSSASASAGQSTSILHSASAAAAAATKGSRKKKRTAKKGMRKVKQESKSKELVLYDHQTVKCGMLVLQCSLL